MKEAVGSSESPTSNRCWSVVLLGDVRLLATPSLTSLWHHSGLCCVINFYFQLFFSQCFPMVRAAHTLSRGCSLTDLELNHTKIFTPVNPAHPLVLLPAFSSHLIVSLVHYSFKTRPVVSTPVPAQPSVKCLFTFDDGVQIGMKRCDIGRPSGSTRDRGYIKTRRWRGRVMERCGRNVNQPEICLPKSKFTGRVQNNVVLLLCA